MTSPPTHELLPFPVLFNPWKHHAGWVRERIADSPDLDALAEELLVVGTRLMDFYTGPLPLETLADRLTSLLRDLDRLEFPAFRDWLSPTGFGMVEVAEDGSRWTLRLGDELGRYIHLHPGRYSPNTVRIQANSLKTAVMAHTAARHTGESPTSLTIVNHVRKRYLDLPPVPNLGASLSEALELLSRTG